MALPADQNQSTTSFTLLKRLWRNYLSRYWQRLSIALLAMVVLAFTMSVIPLIVETLQGALNPGQGRINTRFQPTLAQIIFWGPIIFTLVGITYAIAQYTQSRLSLSAALDTLRDIQGDMLTRYLDLDFAQQRKDASGALASRFTNDIQLLRETLTRSTNGVRDLLQLIFLCIVMIRYDAFLFIAVIAVYGVIGWPIAFIGKKLRRSAAAAQHETGQLAASITETATGSAMVKSYNLGTHEQQRIGKLFDHRTRLMKKAAYLRAVNEPLIFFVGALALGLVVSIIAWRVNIGVLDGPSIVGFIVALALLSAPARGLSTLFAVLQEGLAAFQRLLTIIDARPLITDHKDAKLFVHQGGRVSIKDVSFHYEKTAPVLNQISLEIEAGKTTALVGESGSGKTTLLHLLPRLYDVIAGQILIDGQDIKKITQRSLRQSMAIVSQDAVLFHDTIANNIKYGNPDASISQIETAAHNARAHDFITDFPDGYNTIAGEMGNRLSGGQRQRIAIARAFLKNAPLLLLDEPTASLDAESESAIQSALDQLQKNRTTLIVAHRLSTIRNADLIVVMDKGTVVETGTHENLMKKDGKYAKLIALQYQ